MDKTFCIAELCPVSWYANSEQSAETTKYTLERWQAPTRERLDLPEERVPKNRAHDWQKSKSNCGVKIFEGRAAWSWMPSTYSWCYVWRGVCFLCIHLRWERVTRSGDLEYVPVTNGPDSRRPGFQASLCYWQALWHSPRHNTSLGLLYKMGLLNWSLGLPRAKRCGHTEYSGVSLILV